jgi:hypothetical protein
MGFLGIGMFGRTFAIKFLQGKIFSNSEMSFLFPSYKKKKMQKLEVPFLSVIYLKIP